MGDFVETASGFGKTGGLKMGLRRSFLYIPGNNASMMMKLPVLKPDAILFDLEDAVAPDDKLPARFLIRDCALNMNLVGERCFGVRINGLQTEHWEKDLEIVMQAKPDFIVLPKTESEDDVALISNRLSELESRYGIENGKTNVSPIIETPIGVENVFRIAACGSRIREILIGCEDLALSLAGRRTKSNVEMLYSRARVAAGARAYGKTPIDSAFVDADDLDGLEECLTNSRNMGYGGGVAIAPRQIDVIHKVFTPSQAELEKAQAIIECIEQARADGKGSASLNGKLVDAPIAEMAYRTIELAEMIKGESF